MDATYLRNTLGQAVAKGCAETIAIAPVDPIHHLSLWLLKYVENVKLAKEYQKEKEQLQQEQRARQDKKRQIELDKSEELRKQADTIDQLRLIQNDPYLLFDECLKAVLRFTGGTSAYVALVLDRLWEPPKNRSDTGGGENAPAEEGEEEVEEEEEEMGADGKSNIENASLGEEADDGQLGDSEHSEGENKEKIKPPKPPNYKKKILLYVAATSNNEHLINKKLDKKTVPITFNVLLKALSKLHIANVLYQEGIHFFQGLPLMGAYLSVPISRNANPNEVIALLCVDTLRKEHAGTGRPFSLAEQDFIGAVAQAATQVLSSALSAATGNFDTKGIMKELQNHLEQLEVSHKSESKNPSKETLETAQTIAEPKKKGEAEEGKDQEEVEKEGKAEQDADSQVDETKSEGLDDIKDDEADLDEEEGAEDDLKEAVEEDVEDQKEDQGKEAEDEQSDVYDGQRQMHEAGRRLKEQKRRVVSLQKHFEKSQAHLEKQGAKVVKLEKQFTRLNGVLNHLSSRLTCVWDMIAKHKDEIFGQIKQCLFPTRPVHRVLQALLHVLGQSDAVQDWTRSRQVLKNDILTVMKEFSSQAEMDLKKWDLSDVFLDGITEEELSVEAPIGYLGQQWLLAAKKVAFETAKCNSYKIKCEKATKDFADVEVEQMVAEIDLRVAIDEEKKLSLILEDLQSKFAKELSSSPRHEVVNENEVEDGDGLEE